MTKLLFPIALTLCALLVRPAQADLMAPIGIPDVSHLSGPEFAAVAASDGGSGSSEAAALVPHSEAARVDPPPLNFDRDLLPVTDLLRVPETSGALDNALAAPLPPGDSGDVYADLWERIRENFALTVTDNARVTRQIEWFETHQDYVARMTERGRKYLYYIVDEVEKRGMPSEVALLPIVESAFNPQALSSAKAAGMWQFMPATGKLYGLRQNWWYDGRRDVLAATNSALDYLEKLHAQFGAWDLALAAYNCGEGAVAHAIERNQRAGKPTDYASLPLPEETRNYVPKLLAAREIVADPEAHGLALPSIPDRPFFAVVSTRRHVDLAVAARFADMSEAEFLTLNPGYNRPLILAQGEQNILVPVQAAETFAARLNDPNARLVSWRAHRLRRGESYASVASRFGMSSEELKRVNGIAAHRRVAGGGTILVRDAMAAESDLDALTDSGVNEASIAPPMETVTFSHRVRRGESLASIARRYNVSVASLRTWNRIPRNTGARLGQLLVMHRTSEAGEADLKTGLADATVLSERSSTADPAAAPQRDVKGQTVPFESALVETSRGKHGRHAKGRAHPAGHGKAAKTTKPTGTAARAPSAKGHTTKH